MKELKHFELETVSGGRGRFKKWVKKSTTAAVAAAAIGTATVVGGPVAGTVVAAAVIAAGLIKTTPIMA